VPIVEVAEHVGGDDQIDAGLDNRPLGDDVDPVGSLNVCTGTTKARRYEEKHEEEKSWVVFFVFLRGLRLFVVAFVLRIVACSNALEVEPHYVRR
jgi:hypothetical protein